MVRYLLSGQPISLELPDITQKELDFTDSSFFTANPERRLPTTAEVRALSKDIGLDSKPVPIRYEDLGLIVKFGPHTTITEALNVWMIRTVFGDDVPVPEVFGWRVDDEGYVFIYMELINGPTLEECWDRLSMVEKGAMKDQLSQIMEKLRSLAQDPSDKFIGSINHGQLLDYVFISQPQNSPFPSIEVFNDWFALLHQLPFEHRYDDPNRRLLPDDGDIKFTHCDLNRVNMIVASRSPARLVLVDWEQAGWYPDYWEYCKALYTCWFGSEWHKDYIDKFLQPRTDVYEVFSEYTMAMGAV